jgi:hypothetical protein
MELVGISLFTDAGLLDEWHFTTRAEPPDPYAYVMSANLHRRHLTTEQKRDLIAKLVKAQPEKSDRQIAKETKTSPTTVGTVRTKLEETGDVSRLDTRTDTKGRAQPAHKSGASATSKVDPTAAAPTPGSGKVSQVDQAPPPDPLKAAIAAVERLEGDDLPAFIDWFDRWHERQRLERAARVFNELADQYLKERSAPVDEPTEPAPIEIPPEPATAPTAAARLLPSRPMQARVRRLPRGAIPGPLVVEVTAERVEQFNAKADQYLSERSALVEAPVRTTIETPVHNDVAADPELVAVYKAMPAKQQAIDYDCVMRRLNNGEVLPPGERSEFMSLFLMATPAEQKELRAYLMSIPDPRRAAA